MRRIDTAAEAAVSSHGSCVRDDQRRLGRGTVQVTPERIVGRLR
jgi:hypothetical protein